MTKADVENLLTEQHQAAYQNKASWKLALNAFQRLTPKQKQLAIEGIDRYVRASKFCELVLDVAPIREAIEDAADNRQIWKESNETFLDGIKNESVQRFREKLAIKSTVGL